MNDVENVVITVEELETWINSTSAEYELMELNSSLDNALSLTRDRKVSHSFTVTVVP